MLEPSTTCYNVKRMEIHFQPFITNSKMEIHNWLKNRNEPSFLHYQPSGSNDKWMDDFNHVSTSVCASCLHFEKIKQAFTTLKINKFFCFVLLNENGDKLHEFFFLFYMIIAWAIKNWPWNATNYNLFFMCQLLELM